jgi:hypothetical protein
LKTYVSILDGNRVLGGGGAGMIANVLEKQKIANFSEMSTNQMTVAWYDHPKMKHKYSINKLL